MKNLIFLMSLVAFCTSVTSVSYAQGTGRPDEEVAPGDGKTKVKPGDTHCNSDDVCVVNNKGSGANAYIDPSKGNGNSKTRVNTQTSFEGSVDGIDSNDTVNFGSGNTASVTGNGGTVNVSGGSTITATNGTAGGNMTINLPSGSSITVPPGSNVTVNT